MKLYKKAINTCSDYCRYLAMKANIFLLNTDEGMSLAGKSIDTEEMSETDCLLYWREIELCDFISVSMHQHKRCPLMFRDGKVINELDVLDPLFADSFRFIVQDQKAS